MVWRVIVCCPLGGTEQYKYNLYCHDLRYDLRLFKNIFSPYLDTEVVRPYTPVDQTMAAASHHSSQDSDLYLMIKVYPDGVLTQHLNSLQIGKSWRSERIM